jgi:hypothetical protein
MDIITLKDLGHQNLETTLEYLQIAQLESQQKFSPLDTLLRNASSRCTEKAWKRIETIGLNTWQLRTLSAIKRCRTAELWAYRCL